MRGFPDRPPRSEFGPPHLDRYPVRDPRYEIGAEIFDGTLAQVAGLGLLTALVELELDVSSGGVTINRRAEAWNPDARTDDEFVDPTLVRSGAGVFTIEYPSQIPDDSGELRDVVLRGGWADIIDVAAATVVHCRVIPTAPPSNVVEVRGWTGASTPADGTFLVVLR